MEHLSRRFGKIRIPGGHKHLNPFIWVSWPPDQVLLYPEIWYGTAAAELRSKACNFQGPINFDFYVERIFVVHKSVVNETQLNGLGTLVRVQDSDCVHGLQHRRKRLTCGSKSLRLLRGYWQMPLRPESNILNGKPTRHSFPRKKHPVKHPANTKIWCSTTCQRWPVVIDRRRKR